MRRRVPIKDRCSRAQILEHVEENNWACSCFLPPPRLNASACHAPPWPVNFCGVGGGERAVFSEPARQMFFGSRKKHTLHYYLRKKSTATSGFLSVWPVFLRNNSRRLLRDGYKCCRDCERTRQTLQLVGAVKFRRFMGCLITARRKRNISARDLGWAKIAGAALSGGRRLAATKIGAPL